MDLSKVLEERFGSTWKRAAALGEDAVVEFERDHTIALPEPYRAFVVADAGGAAGPPAYGFFALGRIPWGLGNHQFSRRSLSDPFPLTEAWYWEGETQADPGRIDAVHRDGTLPLGTDGDGIDYALVISGPARGQVWLLTSEGATPVAADFGSWLEGNVLASARWTLDNRP